MTVREYGEREAHGLMQLCDVLCPRCGKGHGFEALGYYRRWLTDAEGEPVRILRRFVARLCGVTISCLPDFCQRYRLVANPHDRPSIAPAVLRAAGRGPSGRRVRTDATRK